MAAINSICVFCASSKHVDAKYYDVARQTGELIAAHAGTLVFGSSDMGMMAAVARGCHAGRGKVVGILPRAMHDHGWAFPDADETLITADMFERKKLMVERSDAFIALSGGFGTLDELFDVIALRQLDYHRKPIVIVNTDGFWSPLLTMLDRLFAERFAHEKHRANYRIVDTPQAAIEHITQGQAGG